MAYSYSKLGGKYLLTDIENTDKAYHSELQRMYKHLHCDCGSSHTNWVTLRRGEEKFVCINCAQTLRADSKNKIKSAMGTYRWHPDEMEAIRTKYSEYSEEHGAANLEEIALTTSQQKKKKTKKKKTLKNQMFQMVSFFCDACAFFSFSLSAHFLMLVDWSCSF